MKEAVLAVIDEVGKEASRIFGYYAVKHFSEKERKLPIFLFSMESL